MSEQNQAPGKKRPTEFKGNPETMTTQEMIAAHPGLAEANARLLSALERYKNLDGADQNAIRVAQEYVDAYAKSLRAEDIQKKKAKVLEMIAQYHDKQIKKQVEMTVADMAGMKLLEELADGYKTADSTAQ